MTKDQVTVIHTCLRAAFPAASIEITDESHLHAGHTGARSGKGHFAVEIRADEFNGNGILQRHRMIYDALGDLMLTDIHALRITAQAPDD